MRKMRDNAALGQACASGNRSKGDLAEPLCACQIKPGLKDALSSCLTRHLCPLESSSRSPRDKLPRLRAAREMVRGTRPWRIDLNRPDCRFRLCSESEGNAFAGSEDSVPPGGTRVSGSRLVQQRSFCTRMTVLFWTTLRQSDVRSVSCNSTGNRQTILSSVSDVETLTCRLLFVCRPKAPF